MPSKKTSAKKIVVATPAPIRQRTPRPRSVKPAETSSLSGSAAVAPQPTLANAPSRDEIANLAYLYWESRGCQGGSPEEDWIRAERELRTRASSVLA
jgi:hypothetical protein